MPSSKRSLSSLSSSDSALNSRSAASSSHSAPLSSATALSSRKRRKTFGKKIGKRSSISSQTDEDLELDQLTAFLEHCDSDDESSVLLSASDVICSARSCVGPLRERSSAVDSSSSVKGKSIIKSNGFHSLSEHHRNGQMPDRLLDESRRFSRIYGLKLGPFDRSVTEKMVRQIMWCVRMEAVDFHAIPEEKDERKQYVIVGLKTWEEVKFLCRFLRVHCSSVNRTAVVSSEYTNRLGMYLCERRRHSLKQQSATLRINGLFLESMEDIKQLDSLVLSEAKMTRKVISFIDDLIPNEGRPQSWSVLSVRLVGNCLHPTIAGFAAVTLSELEFAHAIVDAFRQRFHDECLSLFGSFDRSLALDQWSEQHNLVTVIEAEIKQTQNELMMASRLPPGFFYPRGNNGFVPKRAANLNKKLNKLRQQNRAAQTRKVEWPAHCVSAWLKTLEKSTQPSLSDSEGCFDESAVWVDFLVKQDCQGMSDHNLFTLQSVFEKMGELRIKCEELRKSNLERAKRMSDDGGDSTASSKSACLWKWKECEYFFVVLYHVAWYATAEIIEQHLLKHHCDSDSIRMVELLHNQNGLPFEMAMVVFSSESDAKSLVKSVNDGNVELFNRSVKAVLVSDSADNNGGTIIQAKKNGVRTFPLNSDRRHRGVAEYPTASEEGNDDDGSSQHFTNEIHVSKDTKAKPKKSVRFATPLCAFKKIPARTKKSGFGGGNGSIASLLSQILNSDSDDDDAINQQSSTLELSDSDNGAMMLDDSAIIDSDISESDWQLLSELGFCKEDVIADDDQKDSPMFVDSEEEVKGADNSSDDSRKKNQNKKRENGRTKEKRKQKKKGKEERDKARVVSAVYDSVFGSKKKKRGMRKRNEDDESSDDSSSGSSGSSDDVESLSEEGYVNRLPRMVLRGGKLRPSGGRQSKIRNLQRQQRNEQRRNSAGSGRGRGSSKGRTNRNKGKGRGNSGTRKGNMNRNRGRGRGRGGRRRS